MKGSWTTPYKSTWQNRLWVARIRAHCACKTCHFQEFGDFFSARTQKIDLEIFRKKLT